MKNWFARWSDRGTNDSDTPDLGTGTDGVEPDSMGAEGESYVPGLDAPNRPPVRRSEQAAGLTLVTRIGTEMGVWSPRGDQVGYVELEGRVEQGSDATRRGFLRAVVLGVALLLFGSMGTSSEALAEGDAIQISQDQPWTDGIHADGKGAQGQDGSLWDDRSGLRYTNRKAMEVGDLITVVVTENTSGSNRSSLKTKEENKLEANGGPGGGALDFLPLFGFNSKVKNETDGNGAVQVSGNLQTTITVEVREVRPNGHLVLEGSRLIDLNGEEERVALHGVARTEDIRSDNTVQSNKLSEVRINYGGKGAGKNASRPGIFQRIFGWFF